MQNSDINIKLQVKTYDKLPLVVNNLESITQDIANLTISSQIIEETINRGETINNDESIVQNNDECDDTEFDTLPYTDTQFAADIDNVTKLLDDDIDNVTELLNDNVTVDDKKQYQPTNEQLNIAVKNCKKIYDPANQLPDADLFKMIDDGCLQTGKITLMAFIINTCDYLLKNYEDEQEGLKVTALVSEYCRDSTDVEMQQLLSSRIFNAICSPIPLFDNAAFMQIWADIMELSFKYKDNLVFMEVKKSGYQMMNINDDGEITALRSEQSEQIDVEQIDSKMVETALRCEETVQLQETVVQEE